MIVAQTKFAIIMNVSTRAWWPILVLLMLNAELQTMPALAIVQEEHLVIPMSDVRLPSASLMMTVQQKRLVSKTDASIHARLKVQLLVLPLQFVM